MRPIREVVDAAAKLREPDQWCREEKENALIALVMGLRPKVVVEIGVWRGGSCFPMALAMKAIGGDRALYAIDPWENSYSVTGQTGEHQRWWGQVSHDDAYEHFMKMRAELELESIILVARASSSHALVPEVIDLLHVDGNHAEQSIVDVERFCPHVRRGGIVVMDDVHWPGGNVLKAVEALRAMGFVELYSVDTSVVFQRVFR